MIFREAIEAVTGRPGQRGGEREVRMQIAGQWVGGEGGQESSVVNPATEQALAVVRDASPGQIRQAFQAATPENRRDRPSRALRSTLRQKV